MPMFGKKRSNQSIDRKTINIIDTKGNIISNNFKYHVSKRKNREFEDSPLTDIFPKNIKIDSSVGRRESMEEIIDKDFSQQIYGIGSTPNRRSNTNQGSRSRNNGNFILRFFFLIIKMCFLIMCR
jgi:hypothetical protein